MNKSEYINLPLEQTVQFLLDKVSAHYGADRVLADFGITVLGKRTQAPTEPGEAYGDAYLVGTTEPYDVYIWTRNGKAPGVDGWFDIGPLNVQGPPGVGEKGDKGDPGESTKWRIGVGSPSVLNTDNLGDIYLNTMSGNVWQMEPYASGKRWVNKGSIRGTQGVQGNTGPAPIIEVSGGYITATNPTTGATDNVISIEELKGPPGDQGPVGGFINVMGRLDNEEQLLEISPADLDDMTKAYLVGTTKPYDLYIQVGETSEVAQWLNTGPLNVATLIRVNGKFVETWDADTKVSKLTPESGDRVYYQSAGGVDGYLRMAVSPTVSTLAYRTTGGQLRVGTATMDDSAVPLAQFNAVIASLQAQIDAITPSKNLFRCDFADGSDITVSPTTLTVWGQYTEPHTLKTLREICPNAVAGRTYTLKLIVESGYTDGGEQASDSDVQMWFGDNFPNWAGNETNTFVMSDTMLNAPVTFSVNGYAGQYGPEGITFILKIMMNEGDTLLPWEPPVK